MKKLLLQQLITGKDWKLQLLDKPDLVQIALIDVEVVVKDSQALMVLKEIKEVIQD